MYGQETFHETCTGRTFNSNFCALLFVQLRLELFFITIFLASKFRVLEKLPLLKIISNYDFIYTELLSSLNQIIANFILQLQVFVFIFSFEIYYV